jgi:hypothetical protein
MAETEAVAATLSGAPLLERKMKARIPTWVNGTIVLIALVGGLGYIGFHVAEDLGNIVVVSVWPYVLLGVVCEWISRYRERRGHCHLYSLA